MGWDERIDEMEKRGFATEEDLDLLCNWSHCLVGEALREAGALAMSPSPFDPVDSGLWSQLYRLGRHVPRLAMEWRYADLRKRLAAIRELVAQHYPPPVVAIPEVKAEESARELVEV